jgi:cellulose synthase/poly-beta-1,6-N-acetylglucosamine synthase-like glycosyltransferase
MDLGPNTDPARPAPPGLREDAAPFLRPDGSDTAAAPPRRTARDPLAMPPDPSLCLAHGPATCLADGVLPWARIGGELLVAAQSPRHLASARDRLTATFGPFLRPVETPRRRIEGAMLAMCGPTLARQAESRTPAAESCRTLDSSRLARRCAAGLLLFVALAIAAPMPTLTLGFLLAALVLMVNTTLKLATALATLRAAPQPPPPQLSPDALPRISILIALFRESDIADRLIRRLERLNYPRDRLEVLLVVEEDDRATIAALTAATLPDWMRLIPAPAGTIRTKPRALNLALDFAQGDIIGVYDAEDAPEPDQLQKVAAALATAPPHIACVQAMLDFYNPRRTWIARCFTLEYAMWFRLVLPGLERLGLPLPLGGTSVFLHRDRLAALGGWDAHNVTEDADLGIRLARHGFATRMIDSTTYEEANCHALPWVRQRSRWIKGYLMTWLVHMRRPRALWQDLGTRGMVGFQIIFLGTLAQALLAPLLLSLWSIPLGLGHPLMTYLPTALLLPFAILFLMAEAIGIALTFIALRRSGQRINPLWIPALHAYFPLGTLAAGKALVETLLRPFYWDKTQHGQFHDGA